MSLGRVGATIAAGLRAPSGRLTNLKLFVALALTFATGIGSVATGSAHGRWIVIAHGIAAIVIVLLIPWKSRVVRAGLPRHRVARWASLTLAGLTVLVLLFGFGYATGLVQSVGGIAGMWLHVAFALALVPVLTWHILVRRARPRRTDLSRRTVLRTAVLAGLGAGLYVATTTAVNVFRLPGAARRFTG